MSPTCIGLGPTKTIAKLANAIAKDDPQLAGVCDLRDERDRTRLYERTAVDEVWGVGGRTADKLRALGITTVARFVAMPAREVRSLLTLVAARVQAELQGVSCLPLSLAVPAHKGLAVTRCFGRLVTRWAEMREACAHHAARAGEKLRAGGLVAGRMAVFLHTDPHSGDPWYSAQHAGRIEPTDDARALIAEAVRMLAPLWRDGHRYMKVGVILDDLWDKATQPRPMFPTRDPAHSAALMRAMDQVNTRYERGTLRLQHGFVQAELGHQPFQPGILLRELLELPNVVRFQPGILLLPPIKELLRDADLPDQVGNRQAQLGLRQHRNDLLHREPHLHGQSPHPAWGNPPKN